MGRRSPPRSRWICRALSGLLLAAVATAAPGQAASGAARLGWGRPFALLPPSADEALPPRLTLGEGGEALLVATRQNEEAPTSSAVLVRVRRADGRLSTVHRLSGALEALAAAPVTGGSLVLTGAGAWRGRCCVSAAVRTVSSSGRIGRARTVFGSISGATAGAVTPLAGGALAAVASPAGVWVAQSGRRGFGRASRLSPPDELPEAIAAAATPGGRSIVVWKAADLGDLAAGARRILIAQGTRSRLPSRPRVLVRAAPGHQVDSLGLTSRTARPALAWLESWYDRARGFRSVLRVSMLGERRPAATVSVPREVLSGLTVAGDARGDAAAVVRTCTRFGRCEARVALRGARSGRVSLRLVGTMDAGTTPALAVAADGTALVAWIHRGEVFARRFTTTGNRLGPVRALTRGAGASALRLAFGPDGRAMLAIVEGLAAPRVDGVEFG